MKIRKKTEVKSTQTGLCIFICGVTGVLTTFAFGLPAGIAVGLGGFAAGYLGLKRDDKERADALIGDDFDEEMLRRARRDGLSSFTVETEIKNANPNWTPLGRLVFGDRLTKKTTFYVDEDD